MKKMMLLMISLGMIIFTFVIATAHPFQGKDSPHAVKGVLHLEQWSLEDDGPVKLVGEWELYKEQLLSPDVFNRSDDSAAIQMPNELTYYNPDASSNILQWWSPDKHFEHVGAKTYRLVVKLGEPIEQSLALKLTDVKNSSAVYVNGREVGRHGEVALASAHYEPAVGGYDAYFEDASPQLEIILQAANFNQYGMSNAFTIWLGKANDIASHSSAGIAIELVGAVICFILFLFHLYVSFNTKSISFLYFSLVFASLSVLFLCSGELLISSLVQDIPFELWLKLRWASIIGVRATLQLYLVHEMKGLLPNAYHKITLYSYGLILVFVLLLDSSMYTHITSYLAVYFAFTLTYLCWRLYWRWHEQRYQISSNSVFIYVVMVVCWLISYYNNALYNVGLSSNKMIGSISISLFILLSQLLLAIRYIRNVDRAQRMNKLKDDFFINSANYLRAPLDSMINMSAQMMKREEKNHQLVPSEAYVQAKMMNQLAARIIENMHATIDFTMLKNNELRLQVAPINVRSSLEYAIDAVSVFSKQQEIKVKLSVDSGVCVLGDKERVHQVLFSLIQRAAQRIATSCIEIRVEQSNRRVEIFISDNGAFIPYELQERLFDPNDIEDTGAGLAMYMNKEIVRAMGGRLSLEWSDEERGNCLRLLLPGSDHIREGGSSVHEQLLEIRAEALLPAWNDLGGDKAKQHTILIVEDQYYNIQTLRNMLQGASFQVLYAYSREEALHILSTYAVDLMLLDVRLQGHSGIMLCREIRVQYSLIELPIIIMTGSTGNDELEHGFLAGANDYIRKPFVEYEVVSRVKGMLDLRASMELAVQNELAFLQAQIQPHFIYNAINTMISLCYIDPDKAAMLLTEFSKYLRLVFDTDMTTNEVPIRQELELIEVYVAIERARFGDKYILELDVPSSLRELHIPSLCIQPLVENAIKHGLYSKPQGGIIGIKIALQEERLVITVSDDGVGMTEEQLERLIDMDHKTGVGFSNIQKRIRQLKKASLTVNSKPHVGTEVTLAFSIVH